MKTNYTAIDILKMIKECGNDEKKCLETFRKIESADINEEEMEKLYDNEEYDIFYLQCSRALE